MSIAVRINQPALDQDVARLRKRLEKLKADAVPQATMRALNWTAERAQAATVRELAAVKGVPAKFVRSRTRVYKATSKKLQAAVWIGLKRAILIESLPGARRVTQGAAAGTLRAGRLAITVFEAPLRGGKKALAVRRLPSVRWSHGRSRKTTANLPIERPVVRLNPEAQSIAEAAGRDIMARKFGPELSRLLAREIARLKHRS